MTARRAASILLFLLAVVLLGLAALTPLRSGEVAALDAEAERLARLWAEDQGNEALRTESNEFYDAARDREAPLAPLTALGGALLFGSAGLALWPGHPGTRTDQPGDAADAQSDAR